MLLTQKGQDYYTFTEEEWNFGGIFSHITPRPSTSPFFLICLSRGVWKNIPLIVHHEHWFSGFQRKNTCACLHTCVKPFWCIVHAGFFFWFYTNFYKKILVTYEYSHYICPKINLKYRKVFACVCQELRKSVTWLFWLWLVT